MNLTFFSDVKVVARSLNVHLPVSDLVTISKTHYGRCFEVPHLCQLSGSKEIHLLIIWSCSAMISILLGGQNWLLISSPKSYNVLHPLIHIFLLLQIQCLVLVTKNAHFGILIYCELWSHLPSNIYLSFALVVQWDQSFRIPKLASNILSKSYHVLHTY